MDAHMPPADNMFPSTRDAWTHVMEVVQGPSRIALLTRTLAALADVLPRMGETTAADVAGESSDLRVLYRLISQPETLQELRVQDPLAPARLRMMKMKEELLSAEGGVVGVEEVARMTHLSRQGVNKRRNNGMLIGVSIGRRGYVYPVWQFLPQTGETLPGLKDVLADLGDVDPWTQLAFLLGGNRRLAHIERPLDALRQGNIDAARSAAQMYGQHGSA